MSEVDLQQIDTEYLLDKVQPTQRSGLLETARLDQITEMVALQEADCPPFAHLVTVSLSGP